MRELKDYFCDAEQSKELVELGFNGSVLAVHLGSNLRQIPIAYNSNPHETKAPLRSQALDLFRELGYEIRVNSHTYNKHWFSVIKSGKTHVGETINSYQKAESEAISLCIELENEARNGN